MRHWFAGPAHGGYRLHAAVLFADARGAAEEAGGEHLAGDVGDGEGEVGAGAMNVGQVPRVIDAGDDRHVGRAVARDHGREERGIVIVQREHDSARLGQSSAGERR